MYTCNFAVKLAEKSTSAVRCITIKISLRVHQLCNVAFTSFLASGELLPVDNICKQFGPRSVPTEHWFWLGSKQFDSWSVPKRIFWKSYIILRKRWQKNHEKLPSMQLKYWKIDLRLVANRLSLATAEVSFVIVRYRNNHDEACRAKSISVVPSSPYPTKSCSSWVHTTPVLVEK